MKDHVALIIKNQENEILFIQRSFKKKTLPGVWSFPSGTVEKGENIYETVKREAKEELGIEVEPKETLAANDLPEFSVRLFFILCEIKNGNPSIKEPNEIKEINWMRFGDFFDKFSDEDIGHGLIWLRKNPQLWKSSKFGEGKH